MRPRAICTQAIKLPSQIVSEISGADEQIYLYVIYEAMKEKGKCIIRRKIMDTSALKDYKCDVILVNMAIVDNEVYLDGTYRHMINKIKHLLENDYIDVDASTRDVSLVQEFLDEEGIDYDDFNTITLIAIHELEAVGKPVHIITHKGKKLASCNKDYIIQAIKSMMDTDTKKSYTVNISMRQNGI